MDARERLGEAIDREADRLRAGVPTDRGAAILALLRGRDRLSSAPGDGPSDVVTGRPLADPGGNRALQLILEAPDDTRAAPLPPGDGFDGWGDRFLGECGRLAEAEVVLGHAETGFMRLVEEGDGSFAVWIASGRAPGGWRERADLDWWASWVAERHGPARLALLAEREDGTRDDSAADGRFGRLADVHLATMVYQFPYPPDAELGGCAVRTYLAVLGRLIARALAGRGRGEAAESRPEAELVAALAADLGADPEDVARAVDAFTLDRENAAHHAAVPGVAAAPLVRVAPDRLVWSVRGLTTEPLLFLARELRRRDAEAWNNAAHLREGVFRQDLYGLFADRRFVTGPGRIALRREGGDLRTDVDAVVFDRKSGALGLFELKAQDPFARTAVEAARRLAAFLAAGRQVSGVLAWIQRHGADELLNRADPRTAKRFRVQKVFPFVLGRYLADIGDGPPPDRRAAWGTWPQILRLRDGRPFGAADSNPLASLFARLGKDEPPVGLPTDAPPREIALGAVRLVVYPSYAAYRASAVGDGRSS